MEPTNNTTILPQAAPRDRTSRAESEFSVPEYHITYAQDHTLQWSPPVGSKELAVALSYHFPLQVDLAAKMQAATRRFLRQERDGKKPKNREEVVSRDASAAAGGIVEEAGGKDGKGGTPGLQILTWDSDMNSCEHKTKRRRYDKGERVKVAANRGFACDVHRRQKMKCDPERCSRNKQHINSLEAIPQALPETTTTTTKPDDTTTEPFDPSTHAQDPSFLSDYTDTTPQNSDGLSLSSMTTSDTSPRWSIQSSGMTSANLSFSDTSDSMRPKHDSIESVVSSYDLEFLASLPSYDVSFTNTADTGIEDANNMWWTPEALSGHEGGEGLVQGEYMSVSFPVDQNQNQDYQDPNQVRGNFNSAIEHTSSIPPQHLEPQYCPHSKTSHQDIEIDTDMVSASYQQSSSSLHPEPSHHDPEIDDQEHAHHASLPQPLTTKEKQTLLKWWGRDRLTEPLPPSLPPSSSSISGSRSTMTSMTSRSGMSMMSGSTESSRKERGRAGKSTLALAMKVKSVGVSVGVNVPSPPFLRRGIWRGRSKSRSQEM